MQKESFLDSYKGWIQNKASALWPFGRSSVISSNNTMLSSEQFGLPWINSFEYLDKAQWVTLRGLRSLFDEYMQNPVLYAVIQIKAREYGNMIIKVKNRRTGEIEEKNTKKAIPKQLYKLLQRPNAIQSLWEFLQQRKIFLEVCGNSMTYGNFAMGMQKDFTTLTALWNVWPAYMEAELTGKYFTATKENDIVKKWKFKLGDFEQQWEPEEILHRNIPNVDPNRGLIFGTSPIYSLTRPLTNIDIAYESRNVMMQNRGMRLVFTSNRGDASGKINIPAPEAESIKKKMEDYGMRDGQKQFFFSEWPLTVTPINQKVQDLGLLEEVATDAMMVCNAYGVPEILLKLYLAGATFENQESSYRRLYQGTIIPEANDDMLALNTFLGLEDTDWELVGTFDHISALQTTEKEKADLSKTRAEYLTDLFDTGKIKLNEMLSALGLPSHPEGDQYIYEMSKELQDAMRGKAVDPEAEEEEEESEPLLPTEEETPEPVAGDEPTVVDVDINGNPPSEEEQEEEEAKRKIKSNGSHVY